MSENAFYDIVLNLKSLSNLKEGFPIEYTEKGRKKIDEFKKEDVCVITAIGNSNKGKSYILSKISEFNIPSGYHVTTHGLSILFPDNLIKELNKRFIILDTEGSQNAITIDDVKRKEIEELKEEKKIEKTEEISRDKQMTENFLQSFALESSHIVIAVVGQLTFQDQKFLNRIKEFSKRKDLFIVHNLMFLESKDQVENYIKDTIEASLFFKLEKQTMINLGNKKNENEKDDELRYIYVEEIGDDEKKKKNNIIHLILAREGTEAGKYYNTTTIDYLRNNIISVTKQSKFDVIEKFKKFLCVNASQYFDVPNMSENQLERAQIITSKDIECDDNSFKLNTESNLKLKKCFTDEIGIISYKGLMITPPFSYFKKDGKFTIQIEYCGVLEHYTVKKYITNGQYKFNIVGKTKKESDSKILVSHIDEGDFVLSFAVGLDYIVIKSNEYDEDNDKKNGILNIIYEISEKEIKENDDGSDLGGDDE